MAQAVFPITKARQELGFTPTTAVRADIDVRTGEGAVGAAIGQAVLATAREFQKKSAREGAIELKRRQMTDANSSVAASKLRQIADAEFETFKLTNPQGTWEKFRSEQTTKVGQEVASLNFSPDALTREQVKSTAYTDVETARALTDATRQLREDTIAAQTEALTDAFRSADPEKIIEAVERFMDNGTNMGKDKVEVLSDIKAAREAGGKLRKKDTLDGWRDRIAENPTTTAEVLNTELEARKKNKGIISEEVLTSKDIQSLLNTATNRQAQLTANTEREVNAKNKALETKLHNDILAGIASITDIQKSGLPAEVSRRLERDIGDIAKRNIQKTWAVQDSSDAVEGVNTILVDIEAGQVDINEARTALNELAKRKTTDGRSILTQRTFEKTMEQFKKGGRDAIDLFTDEQTDKVTNFLVLRLTEREARFRIRFEARTLTNKEIRQFSTTGFLLQVAKHQLLLYKEGLAQRLRVLGIEDTSGKEAKAEAVKVWESIKRKPLEQRINDFLNASGQELVRPFGIPVETWEVSSSRNKAAIVRAVSRGMDNKQILELLIK